jgi:ribosomal protein S27AE
VSDDSPEPEQGRLQEYGVDTGAAPVDDGPPACERCGDQLEGDTADGWVPKSRGEEMTGVVDLARGRERRYLCEGCKDLKRYLSCRYHELTEQVHISGAVAVYCGCQGEEEVDVQPVRRGEATTYERECSRCGSSEVVVEQLPPDGPPTLSGGEQA